MLGSGAIPFCPQSLLDTKVKLPPARPPHGWLGRTCRKPLRAKSTAAEAQGPEKVPLSELPEINKEAQKRLHKIKQDEVSLAFSLSACTALLCLSFNTCCLQNASQRQAMWDRLGSLSFTLIGDNSELNWAIAQVCVLQSTSRLPFFLSFTRIVLSGCSRSTSENDLAMSLQVHCGGVMTLASQRNGTSFFVEFVWNFLVYCLPGKG